ncbi:FKBP12-associated protein 1 -like protein [Escovopsis weberi]|uniref:FKBP12-associated protein 1-like protein n=1 Tax=Escovopsis weberi TaxID=150374 RepID=A0A0M8MYU6_ESCWE|nr:FKBP12-associated protein 1 -like protein [Escovopsis weberi]
MPPSLCPSDIKPPKSTAANLGVRIHEDISNRNYECAVCTDDILRTSHIWSCTVCWTVVHLKCAKKWFNSGQKQSAPPSADGPPEISWRCPGCNSKLVDEPGYYHCWCGKDVTPKPSSASLPPHSCGQTCSKPRATCPHPCPLQCHAGPCPPCDLPGPEQSCFCGKNASRKLCRETDYEHGWSCQDICGDLLPCGEHSCPRPCHSGLCGGCDTRVDAKCYCGRLEKTIPCFERGDPVQSFDWRGMGWFEGSFNCEQPCDRNYDCDVHKCTESCHPEEEQPAHCPYSPDVVTHCPCGKTPLDELLENPRYFCQDPVPHCDKVCRKMLPCGHLCKATCHVGDCGFCAETVDIPCRCGRTASPSICHQSEMMQEPWCTRTCQATLSCGRHRCGEHCCPGEKKAAERLALRKKNRLQGPEAFVEAEHICIKTCGRPLKCGSHNCQQICHRGSCASCPEAIFHEISCDCGRTVLRPPLPCGTHAPECRFSCSRRPACGHPAVEHNCHGDDVACPKCPFLVDKWCACGKEKLKSQPCHLQAARCGQSCKKDLKCGKLCHKPGECEDGPGTGQTCAQACGKTKLFCDHPCQLPCHGHTVCIESGPCTQKTIVSCPCGLRQQEVKCLASSSNPEPSRPEIKCDDECLRLERNRRLAAALNIDPASHTNDHIPYSDTTLELFRENTSWAETQEREFRVFSRSANEQRLRYKPMPRQQRQFLHCLAGDYGLDSISEDAEPHRYVLVWKGQKFVAPPSKTLAQCVKIRDAQAAAGEPSTAQPPPAAAAPLPPAVAEPFNAFVLIGPRFGLTIEDVDAALRAELAAQSSFAFSTAFVSSGEEVLIRAAAHYSALLSPASVEAALAALKPKLAAAVARADVARNILLCHADGRDDVSRRENIQTGPDAAGWSAVAGRAAARSQDAGGKKDGGAAGSGPGRRMLGLRRKGPDRDRDKLWTAQLGGDTEC